MINHFAMAEKLLGETDALDPTLPFVIHKVARAGVHAQLATVQAFLGGCDCDTEYPLPWQREISIVPKEGCL